ncbi:hypothetical protein PILCRDRAFT_819661 [Piloderma croceum F 1598]|uniref:Uncharacterized protein n=1 Tax=Piloderma croceum (strain F 1598) TaxID=765440 RepID=A0A0C3FYT0_PILCF|nr:hypothetical protein PILCRDRAFT_819661 [Piloderma croceum F 1598]
MTACICGDLDENCANLSRNMPQTAFWTESVRDRKLLDERTPLWCAQHVDMGMQCAKQFHDHPIESQGIPEFKD